MQRAYGASTSVRNGQRRALREARRPLTPELMLGVSGGILEPKQTHNVSQLDLVLCGRFLKLRPSH